jgi:DNA-binding CsgD family transcriptional regulator
VATALDQLAWDGGVSTRRAFGMSTAVMSLAEMGRHDEARALQATLDDAFHGKRCWALSRLADWSRAVAAGLSSEETPVPALIEVCGDAAGNNYWHWARWMLADLAEGAARGHDPAAAARAVQLLESDPWPPAGAIDGALRSFVAGAAATVLGGNGEGLTSLNQAADAFGLAGWPLMEGRALALLGASLVRIDRSRALEALEQAMICFGRCGATVRQQRILTQLDALGPRGRRKRTQGKGAGSLSGREREVARLASEGCSAREIAERLFIGERTVETHLANVYAKLGVASKLDLVRRAQELGI